MNSLTRTLLPTGGEEWLRWGGGYFYIKSTDVHTVQKPTQAKQ